MAAQWSAATGRTYIAPGSRAWCKARRKDKQKWNIVAPQVEIAMIDIGDVGQGIQILNLRPVRIVHHRAISSEKRFPEYRRAACLARTRHRIVEFFAADEINRSAIFQGPVRKHGHMRTDKRNLNLGINALILRTS